jgi:transposase
MGTKTKPDAKEKALRRHASLNPHPEAITDPLFSSEGFFDKRDIVQVKYEMVRRVRVDGHSVSESAAAFGFSRPSFYQAQAALDDDGLSGLIPKKRGPRSSHKLDEEVMAFVAELLEQQPSLRSKELVARIQERFDRRVHPRSVERALARSKKNRR